MSREITHYQRPNSVWDFMREVESVFDDLWTAPKTPSRDLKSGGMFSPPVDVHESNDSYLLTFDLPGIPQKDLKIDLQEGRLTVSGERHHEQRKDEGLFKRYERSSGTFERSFQLPKNIDEGKIQARMENGILEILIPKAEVAKPRAIKVEVEKTGLFSKLLGKEKSVEAEGGAH